MLKIWIGVRIDAGKLTPLIADGFVPSVYWTDISEAIVAAMLTELLLPATTVLSKSSATKVNVTGEPLTWKPLMPEPKFHVAVQADGPVQAVEATGYCVPFSKRYILFAKAVA